MSTAPSPAISPKKQESANNTTKQDVGSFPSRVARGFGHQGIMGELQRLVDFDRKALIERGRSSSISSVSLTGRF